MLRRSEPQAHLQPTSLRNVRLVPVDPHVKSAKTRELFNADVSGNSKTGKSTDPICYNVSTVELTGLFDNVEMNMNRFKRGDVVWCFWQDRFGYPQLHHRPYVITKKVHPTCYVTACVANDYNRPREQWVLDRTGRQRHPSDLLAYSDTKQFEDNRMDAIEHLRELRRHWAQTVDAATYEAWKVAEAENKRASDAINRRLRPIMARMFA